MIVQICISICPFTFLFGQCDEIVTEEINIPRNTVDRNEHGIDKNQN